MDDRLDSRYIIAWRLLEVALEFNKVALGGHIIILALKCSVLVLLSAYTEFSTAIFSL